MIDPPYGFGKETWDSTRWGYDQFDFLFKKITAIDQRKMVFVITFGTIFFGFCNYYNFKIIRIINFQILKILYGIKFLVN